MTTKKMEAMQKTNSQHSNKNHLRLMKTQMAVPSKISVSVSETSHHSQCVFNKGRAPEMPFLKDLRIPVRKFSSFKARPKRDGLRSPQQHREGGEFFSCPHITRNKSANHLFEFSETIATKLAAPTMEGPESPVSPVANKKEESVLPVNPFANFKVDSLKVSIYRRLTLTIFHTLNIIK